MRQPADNDAGPGAFWDERYTEVTWSAEPDQVLVEIAGDWPPATAVDLGGGTGRNALWLASRGWSVTIVDASAVGLGQAASRARELGVTVTRERADLLDWSPRHGYDLVVLANIHLPPPARERVFATARAAVAPGGHLFAVGHHVRAVGLAGPPDPARLYTEEILAGLASGLRIERLRTVTHRADHGEMGSDVVLLAKRPDSPEGEFPAERRPHG